MENGSEDGDIISGCFKVIYRKGHLCLEIAHLMMTDSPVRVQKESESHISKAVVSE